MERPNMGGTKSTRMLQKQDGDGVCGVNSAGLRQRQVVGPSEHWSSIKCEKSPDQEQVQALSSAGCGK